MVNEEERIAKLLQREKRETEKEEGRRGLLKQNGLMKEKERKKEVFKPFNTRKSGKQNQGEENGGREEEKVEDINILNLLLSPSFVFLFPGSFRYIISSM